jgi:DNA-binding NtrC family response regulator
MSHRNTPLPLPPVASRNGQPGIYVVNSDAEFLEMIGDLLADSQVTVSLEQMHPDVAVTLDNLRLARPNLLLLDVIPFRPVAERLLDEIEADPGLWQMSVIVASTSPAAAAQVAKAHPRLVRDILPKPFGLDEFYDTLSRHVAGIRRL